MLDGDLSTPINRPISVVLGWSEWIAHIDTDANNLPVGWCALAVNRVKNVYTKMDVG
jgi:hypothetical protein